MPMPMPIPIPIMLLPPNTQHTPNMQIVQLTPSFAVPCKIKPMLADRLLGASLPVDR